MEHVTPTDCVTGNHRHHWFRRSPDLNLQVENVESADPLLCDGIIADVSIVAADHLVAAGAECPVALAGQHG